MLRRLDALVNFKVDLFLGDAASVEQHSQPLQHVGENFNPISKLLIVDDQLMSASFILLQPSLCLLATLSHGNVVPFPLYLVLLGLLHCCRNAIGGRTATRILPMAGGGRKRR